MADTSSLASLLSGLFTGAAGIQQLTSNSNTTAANTASPFQGQYAGYQPQVQGSINAIGGQQSGTNGNLTNIMNLLENNAGNGSGNTQNVINALSGLGGMTQQNLLPNASVGSTTAAEQQSGGTLSTQLANLNQNYMSNPAIQSMLTTGMQTVNRGLASQGLAGSGAQQAELQSYGQNFAAQEYNQQFSNDIAGSNAAYTQNMGVTQENQSLNQANFTNLSSADSLLTQQMEGEGSLANGLQSNVTSALGQAGSVGTNNSNLLLNSSQGLLNSLEALSGATTGSPSTAGIIESNQFGQTQQGIANLGSGATGILTSLLGTGSGSTGLLSSLFSGGNLSSISNTLSSLFSGGSTLAEDTIGGLSSSLGSSTEGGLESLLAGGADSGASEGLSALLGL